MDGKRKRQREKEDRSPEAKKIKIVLPEEGKYLLKIFVLSVLFLKLH